MGFSCIGGEMERLVLLVLFFFEGGKRSNKRVQREPFFRDCFAVWRVLVHSVILSSASLTPATTDTATKDRSKQIKIPLHI